MEPALETCRYCHISTAYPCYSDAESDGCTNYTPQVKQRNALLHDEMEKVIRRPYTYKVFKDLLQECYEELEHYLPQSSSLRMKIKNALDNE